MRRRLTVSCNAAPPPRLCSSRRRRLQLMLQPASIAAGCVPTSSRGRSATTKCTVVPAEAPCSGERQPPIRSAQGSQARAAGGGAAALELLRDASWDVSDLVSDGAKALRLRKTPYAPPEVRRQMASCLRCQHSHCEAHQGKHMVGSCRRRCIVARCHMRRKGQSCMERSAGMLANLFKIYCSQVHMRHVTTKLPRAQQDDQ